jgi:hypothetical protein
MAIDQRTLNPELSKWLDDRQSALQIVKTTTTPSGQILDWVPIESQHPTGHIASPPPRIAPAVREDKERPVRAAALELDDPAVERGPAGTVPLVRPDFSRLTRTVALKDFLNKRGGLAIHNARDNQPGAPNPAGYFHAQEGQSVTTYGCDFFMNVWDPVIDNPQPPGDDHSILQTWLLNTGSNRLLQSVEGGWTVDLILNGDLQPHIFTYFTTNNYAPPANNTGGYNRTVTGWQQSSGSVFPGIRINGISTYGGPQLEVSMKFQLYREPTNGQLNWWVAVQGIWMGYYPASLYSGGMASGASSATFGGEVESTLSNPELTKDQMGSGSQAKGGWTHAAYMRNLRYQTDLNGTMTNSSGTASTDAAAVGGADPYTIQSFMNSGSSWGSYVYVGGPSTATPQTPTFNQITFNIGTGGDDLRGDSSAVANVVVNGQTQTFTLKAQSDGGWGNNSDHVKTFNISGPPQPRSAFGPIKIILTSHNSFFETDDNWNIQSVNISLNGSSGSACLLKQSGNPLARLTGSGPSVTLSPFGGC